MSSMIDTQVVAEDDIPLACILSFQEGEDVLSDPVIHRVQIPDVERIICVCEIWLEVVREKRMPCVVSKMDNALACIFQLSDQVVLVDGLARKVAANVNERGQSACCKPLQPLHRGSGWICDKRQQERVLWLVLSRLVQDWKRVVEMAWGDWRRLGWVRGGRC
ncbi:GPI ethanolamine phosphate transferase 3 [Pyrenophora tritici-repentis]|nr:GPI ethanolamine phosphate transferase 3 [Pyrenophora tritici-repentis]KAI1526009.1 GPI ethanolamine phosphate transferase 3 [Pyrenophora tritici-repentis]PWO23885.1 hypothetical protein PtrARCrB10_07597 [Pyrenophora tritici-repentis]